MKKKMTQGIVTSGLALAMILTMVNMPAFSVGAKAEETSTTEACEHDFSKGQEMSDDTYSHYVCSKCNKWFDENKMEHDESYFYSPYFEDEDGEKTDSIDITLGEQIDLHDIIKGEKGVQKIYMKDDDPSKYEKYLTFDEGTWNIETEEYYKVKLNNPTITLIDKQNNPKDVTINVKLPKPDISITRDNIVLGGISGYKYTVKYNRRHADKLSLTVKKGSVDNSTRNKMNSFFKTKLKAKKGSFTFTIKKSSIKKNKINFTSTAEYGKGKYVCKVKNIKY